MKSTKLHFQQFRENKTIEKVCVRTVSSPGNNDASSLFVSLQDIRDVFPNALRFKLNGDPIPFLIDLEGNRIEPPRIAFYPDEVLDVIAEVPQFCNSNSNAAYHSLASRESEKLTSQDVLFTLSTLTQSLTKFSQNENTNFEKITKMLQAAEEKEDRIIKLQMEAKEKEDKMIKLQLEAKEKEDKMIQLQLEAKEKEDKMIKLQLEAREKDDKIYKLQLEAKEKDDKMLKMQKEALSLQHQALDRLVILQKHAEAILIQNFELHEYPIPRLFIILPVDRTNWNPIYILRNRFRLHFLCECGDHSVKANKNIQNQMHLARHEGYEVQNSTEFFRKYGKYMIILLRWLKVGMSLISAASQTPVSDLLDAGIDYSLDFMEALSVEHPVLNNLNTIDDYEALEGADLRQLSTFLQINDEDRQLGNLYRVTTETGHVKWVCVDHYRSTYREKEQEAFKNVVEVNHGKYDPHLGKVVIKLRSRTRAEEFFTTLTNAKHIYEVDITFDWDWAKTDLEALENGLKRSSVSILRLDIGWFQESITRKLHSTTARYEILARIIGLHRMKTIHVILPPDLIRLPSLPPQKPSHLHKLSFEMKPQGIRSSELRVLVNSLKTNTTLTYLDLYGNGIRKDGLLTLSKALKANATLTTLGLGDNSIGKGGALALSEALMVNTTLIALDLNNNKIGKEGALSLSEALKSNTTLTYLVLGHNSIKNKGTIALAEALRINTALSTLKLEGNLIGDEGAVALSEALAVNTALKALCLNENLIEKEGVLVLSEALKTNMTLTILDLGFNKTENEGALALSEALTTNRTLITLDLYHNSIGQEGIFALSKALKTNTTLTNLCLEGNSIGNEGAQALSKALKINTGLSNLDLRANSIRKEGALALSEMLKTNKTLTELILSQNSIGEGGAVALSEALKVNRTLTILDLYYNSIGKKGALALSEALKTNTTLVTLYLGGNSIGDEGALALSEALKIKTALTTLHLCSNEIGGEGTLALSEALKANAALTIHPLNGIS